MNLLWFYFISGVFLELGLLKCATVLSIVSTSRPLITVCFTVLPKGSTGAHLFLRGCYGMGEYRKRQRLAYLLSLGVIFPGVMCKVLSAGEQAPLLCANARATDLHCPNPWGFQCVMTFCSSSRQCCASRVISLCLIGWKSYFKWWYGCLCPAD